MLMCYVDESSDTGSLVPTERNSQPIFLMSAVIVKQTSIAPLTRSIIDLKRRFFPAYGNGYDYLAELPLFGHSENHAMLQLADWVGSAFLAPMATRAYYADLGAVCVHADPAFDIVRTRLGQRVKALQYRYEQDGRKLGGVAVLAGGLRKVSPLQVFGPLPPESVVPSGE